MTRAVRRRRWPAVVAAAIAACALSGCGRRAPAAPQRVVVVVIDTLRRDHLPAYGYAKDTAPFLSRVAAGGVVFENAYAPSSWTAPSTASLFTSLYPFQHGVVLGLRATRKVQAAGGPVKLRTLPEAVETLPEAMRRAGYATFGLTENVNVSREMGFAQGFERFRNLPADDSADVLHARLMAWRKHLAQARRSFLYLHYLDPHSPYYERAPWFDSAAQGPARELSAYDSEIRYADEHLRLAWEALQWERDALLVVTADHGEEFREHGSVEHGRSLFGEVLNVPLIVRFPGGAFGGTRVAEPVSLIDVLPTLREAVGQPPAPADEGRSLMPLVRGERTGLDGRALYAHLWRPEPQSGVTLDLRAVLHGGRKLVAGTPGATQLFDLHRDPLDQADLAARFPQLCAELDGRYAAFSRSARRHGAPEKQIDLDEQARESLRALGYVE